MNGSGNANRFFPLGSRARRVGAGLAVGALSAAFLAGCASPSGSTTLTVQAGSVHAEFLEAFAATFEEENPGVDVVIQSITEEQKITTNGQVLASANSPDIGWVPTNAQSYTDLLERDGLVPLDDVWESEDLDARYGEDVAASLKSGETPYVVLLDAVLYNVVFYNADTFEELGIEVPEDRQIDSNEELYEIAAALREGGAEPLSIGGSAGYKWGWLLDGQLFANATPEAFTDFTTSWRAGEEQEVPYTDGEFVDSLTQIQEWYDAGVFAEGVLGMGDEQSLAAFTSESAAMYLGGSFSVPSLQDAAFSYDWLLLPGADAGAGTVPTSYTGDTLAISKQSDNPELAKDFLSALMSDEAQKQLVEAAGVLPAVNTLDQEGLEPLGDLVGQILEFTSSNGAGVGWTSVLPGALAQQFIDPQIQRQLTGAQTVEETAEAQQGQYESFVAD